MQVDQIFKVMRACGFKDYGMDKLSLLEMSLERDANFDLSKAKDEIVKLLAIDDFDWVNLAIESKFVYTSSEVAPKKFSVDDLLIFTDSFRWDAVVKSDSLLSTDQKDGLKDQFREVGVQYFEDICELMIHSDFDWLPFEVKHAFKLNFKEISYINEDIVFYFKSVVWEYLFPNSLDQQRLVSLRDEGLMVLGSVNKNQGWIDASNVVKSLRDCYSGLDLYELSRVNWPPNIEHKIHYRNPFTLGFIRVRPAPES